MDEREMVATSDLSIPGETVQYGAGATIMAENVGEDFVFEITQGLAKVFTINGRDQQYVHLIVGPGELFPTAWLIGREYKGITVEAIGPVTVRRYDRRVFIEEIRNDGVKALEVMRRMAADLNLYATRLDNLEFKYASERLAYRLLVLAQRFGQESKLGVRLPPFTNQDIGQTINLSRESVNRELSRFGRLGLTSTRSGIIHILDYAGLRKEVSKSSKPLFIDDVLLSQRTDI